ncbi:unnamed protein product (macronuclear) [Paramecium tetraurelia]|uniref:Phosphoglycerate kinase n=1 Tax=Paramecium tetraurelia TaxID=5888 RepID=A0DGG4_PARTE|nr:uncharacterized protein GSPATT00002260001 [Paramecium tetraurelia]CAK82131.1 unnamed protein product [Paramecium tetraurelia]|eukprot:XP_001449528.1 hypothetical protein (macronuclear) [Paramecium tetraurelia strain d4-2]
MLNKYFTFYKVCREKTKLYKFIKNVYVSKIQQVEESLLYANDLQYTISTLENIKLIQAANTTQIVNISRQIFHNYNISKLDSPQSAVDLIQVLVQNISAKDVRLYREIYKFYKKHAQYFTHQQVETLQKCYYHLARQIEFNDLIQIDEKTSVAKHTEKFNYIQSDIYQLKQQEDWSIMIKEDPQSQTSSAILTHKNGIVLRIQGVFQNNYESIIDTQKLISEKKPDIIILNMAPIAINENKKDNELDIQKTVDSYNEPEKVKGEEKDEEVKEKKEEEKEYEDEETKKIEQVFVTNFDPLIEELTKKFQVNDQKKIITGYQQGFQVPFTMESLLYQFSQQKRDQKQPIILLGGLSFEDQIKMYLQGIPIGKMAQELSSLRFQWLNQLLANFSDIQQTGCILCNSQPNGVIPPSKILNESPKMKKIQADFLGELTNKYIGSSGKKQFLVIVQQQLFLETLRSVAQRNIEKNDVDIDIYRQEYLEKKQGKKVSNKKHYKVFQQFYEDALNFDKTYKYCSQEMLDLNKFSSVKYKKGLDLRCGIRDILF